MRAFTGISCAVVVAAIAFLVLAATSVGMTRPGPQAPPEQAVSAAAAQQAEARALTVTAYPARVEGIGMTAAGLHAHGDTQGIAIYPAAEQTGSVPVQWHDVFTGVGVTLGVVLLVGAGVLMTRSRQHRHHGRPTLAH